MHGILVATYRCTEIEKGDYWFPMCNIFAIRCWNFAVKLVEFFFVRGCSSQSGSFFEGVIRGELVSFFFLSARIDCFLAFA